MPISDYLQQLQRGFSRMGDDMRQGGAGFRRAGIAAQDGLRSPLGMQTEEEERALRLLLRAKEEEERRLAELMELEAGMNAAGGPLAPNSAPRSFNPMPSPQGIEVRGPRTTPGGVDLDLWKGEEDRLEGLMPRATARRALAERNINSLTGGGLSPAEQDASRARVQSRTGPGGVMAPRGVNPHSLTPGPQISTAIPGAAPEGPRFDPNDPSQLAARMNNGVGGLHILRPLPESRVVDREGLAERRAASQAEREQELAAREAHRMQFYKNRQQSQAQAAAQNAFLQRIMQLPPGVASAVIEGQTRTGIAGMENDRLREMGDTKSREQGAALYIALIEAGMSPDDALARVQQFGFSPGDGAGPGVTPGPAQPRRLSPGEDGVFSLPEVRQWVDSLPDDVSQISPDMLPPTDVLIQLWSEVSSGGGIFGEDPVVKMQRERLKARVGELLRLRGVDVSVTEQRQKPSQSSPTFGITAAPM